MLYSNPVKPSSHIERAARLGVTRFAAEHPDRVNTLILNGTIAFSSAGGDAQRASALSDQRKADLKQAGDKAKDAVGKHRK